MADGDQGNQGGQQQQQQGGGQQQQAAWHAGLDAEVLGAAQRKGWDLTDPAKAFAAAATAYSGAEKLVGAPPDKILRMPEASADPTVLDAFWGRLGAVKDAKDIDLAAVKGADGKPFDEKLGEVIRTTAIANRVPKDIALTFATSLQKHFDTDAAAKATIRAGEIAAEQEALNRSWGAAKDHHLYVADQTLQKLAVAANLPLDKAKAAWDALSTVGGIGSASAMEMLRVIGVKMGEDKFVSNGSGNGNVPMTREAAISEIAALKVDQAFRTRLLAGDVEANKQWSALHKIGYGQQQAA